MKQWFKRNATTLKISLSVVGSLFLIFDYFYKWGILTALWKIVAYGSSFVAAQPMIVAFILLLIFTIYMYDLTRRFKKYFPIYFKENFRRALAKNWEYTGTWQIVQRNQLYVTESDIGGITKFGHWWSDYIFQFQGTIVNDRVGWIVRAQDLFNYYMIQLTPTHIRPHLRIAGRWIVLTEIPHNQQIQLNEDFKISTEVRGAEIRVAVNGKEIFFDPNFFSLKALISETTPGGIELKVVPLQPNTMIVPPFSTGRIGFRMCGNEAGRIKKCKVTML